MFVLKGPYANAILRFKITFPPDFPHSPPAIVFKTDVFHPLVSPIPALGQKTRNWDSEPMDSDAQRRQIPGMFWLEHGFPHWFGRTGSSSRPSGQTFNFPSSSKVVDVTAYEILDYMRSTFDTESVLTSIPLEAAAHPSAFHAWRAHKNLRPVSVPGARGEASQGSQSGAESTPRKPSEWNWDGVWRERVSRGIQASSNEAAIFGALGTSTPSGDDIVSDLLGCCLLPAGEGKLCSNPAIRLPLTKLTTRRQRSLWRK